MYSKIISGALFGMHAYQVGVEVDIASGLPAFTMVGSLNAEVRESRERVCVALKNAGFRLPAAHVTVNLSPADKKKEGTAFDLPIAVGILQTMEYFPEEAAKDILFLGELGLNGEVRKVKGVLPIVREAAKAGVRECIVPGANALEGAVIPGITVRGATRITEVLDYLKGRKPAGKEQGIWKPVKVDAERLFAEREGKLQEDFAQINGQETAKRAAEIAAAGFHNLLMMGPPGVGKSMIAKCIPGILPPLTLEESLEVTSVMSVAGLLQEEQALVTERPFHSPHHTVSQAALTGGSGIPRPGIISLAHRGVLFLDELPEFPRSILDSMRQPLEEHEVRIARAGGNVAYPADFMLVCAMNPCPCGYYPDRQRCRCSQTQVRRYAGKVSGPILDRVDLCVELQPVSIWDLHGERKGESSGQIRERVMRARKRQEERYEGSGYRFNGDVKAADLERFCFLGKAEKACMKKIYENLNISARAYHRILKVARTIADLADAEEIREEHLLEAACFRPSTDYGN